LGAYGLAGRAIATRLIQKTPYAVIAAGRNADRLHRVLHDLPNHRVQSRLLDAEDVQALRQACQEASIVINAVGPFAKNGEQIAKTVVECKLPYVDCANEQVHYHRLKSLDSAARNQGIPLITGAGAIPGFSTLLLRKVLEDFAEATHVDCVWAQCRHAYAQSGLGSMMGGILEAAQQPVATKNGQPAPVIMGRSVRTFCLPEPFGMRRLLEVPTLDNLLIPERFSLQEFHTWFYLGDLPLWLLELVRVLQPHRRPWTYRLIEKVMHRINDHDTNKAIRAHVGPEALLMVYARNARQKTSCHMLFRDGAMPTACLPTTIADMILKGQCSRTGLLTPLDLIDPNDFLSRPEDAILSAHLDLKKANVP